MSLKAFHIFFISIAVLLCLGFGVWCFRQSGYVALGIGSFGAAAALVVYEVLFLKGCKPR